MDALVKLDEDTVITGSADGLLRIVSILPNKMIGVVGQHPKATVEQLAISPLSGVEPRHTGLSNQPLTNHKGLISTN